MLTVCPTRHTKADMVSEIAPKFDVKSLIDNEFGGPGPLYATIQREVDSASIKYDSVYRWTRRGSLPCEWLAVLLTIKERETGAPMSLAPYLARNTECPASKAKHSSSGATPSPFD